jgi:hypothetical protein
MNSPCRHCEEQSDEAIQSHYATPWIASLSLAMTNSIPRFRACAKRRIPE